MQVVRQRHNVTRTERGQHEKKCQKEREKRRREGVEEDAERRREKEREWVRRV